MHISRPTTSNCDHPLATARSKLFCYSSGRFLFNEEIRLRERYVEFDIDELQAAAQRSVEHAHRRVMEIRKLAEGGFNRVLLLQMQDGFEIIAKIPYHIAGPAFYATASEAATLAFLKAKEIPVPNVYAYCADAQIPVRCGCILMEKVTSVSVSSR